MADKLPTTMRAAQWTPTGGAAMETLLQVNSSAPLPPKATALPPQSILVRVHYASLNPVDFKLAEFGPMRTLAMGKAPFIPGCDFAGTVVASSCADFQSGDRVFGSNPPLTYSSCAEYVVVTDAAKKTAKLPDGLAFADAAALDIAGLTAYQCVAPAAKPGAHILINGASGGTGSFGVQIAKILGAHVTAVCSAANADMVRELGADAVVDYRAGDLVQQLVALGTQFDLVVDNVGFGGPLYTQMHRYSTPSARYVTVAGAPSMAVASGAVKTLLLPGWLGGGKRKASFLGRRDEPEQLAQLAQWVVEGKLKPVIEKVYELDEISDAFTKIKSGRTKGKIVIKIAGEA